MTTRTFGTQCVLFIGLILMLTTAGPGAAAQLFVKNDGIDSPTCGSDARPCRSISQGVENATDGDMLIVHPGLYGDLNDDGNLSDPGEEHFNAAQNCAICIDKRLTILSLRGTRVTIINIPRISSNQAAVEIAAPGVKFGTKERDFDEKDFDEFDGKDVDRGFMISGDNDFGIRVQPVRNVSVVGNLVLNALNTGIFFEFSPQAGSALVADNTVIGTNRSGQGGIFIETSGSTVAGNVVIGAEVEIGGTNAKLTGNLVSNSQGAGFALVSGGIVATHNSAINNGFGFQVGGPTLSGPPIRLVGNRIIGNRGPGILVPDTQIPLEAHQNDIYGNNVEVFRFTPGGTSSNCGLFHFQSAPVNATNNFWGSPKGPGPVPANNVGFAAGCDDSNTTVFVPFATTPFGLGGT
jgi:hypothetical protein